jgi:predicted TIM-barrel fold metal-dependent hydrolase
MAINGMTVVDSHVHLLPGRLGQKVRAFFDAGVSSSFTLAYPNDHPVVIDTLAREGVDAIWTLPYAHKAGVAEGLNAASAETVAQFAQSPVRVIGGLTIHPADENPVAIVRQAVDVLGLRVLKLHCSVGNFAVDDVRLEPVFTFASERHLPAVVHLGHNVNGRTDAEELPAIGEVADKFPGMPLILAHCGHHAAPEAIALMDLHPSLHADLTPVVTEHPTITAEHIARHPDRILFGSDCPNTTLSVTACIAWLTNMNVPQDVLQKVLGGNALRLTAAVITD